MIVIFEFHSDLFTWNFHTKFRISLKKTHAKFCDNILRTSRFMVNSFWGSFFFFFFLPTVHIGSIHLQNVILNILKTAAAKTYQKKQSSNKLYSYLYLLVYLAYIFFNYSWLPYDQLWAITDGTASFTGCWSLCLFKFYWEPHNEVAP